MIRIDGLVVVTTLIMTMMTIQCLCITVSVVVVAVVVVIILREDGNLRIYYHIQIEHLLEVMECMRLDLEEDDQIGYTY
jgi:hypothetical protein